MCDEALEPKEPPAATAYSPDASETEAYDAPLEAFATGRRGRLPRADCERLAADAQSAVPMMTAATAAQPSRAQYSIRGGAAFFHGDGGAAQQGPMQHGCYCVFHGRIEPADQPGAAWGAGAILTCALR